MSRSVVIDPVRCSGCGACANVCPGDAIAMREDAEGFFKPVIAPDACCDCGRCEERCPVLHPVHRNNPTPGCLAFQASDEIRRVSSSGGFFHVAAMHTLSAGGHVCGVGYKADFTPRHVMIDGTDGLADLRGSKYIQSDAGDIYRQVSKRLAAGGRVLFTGSPCHVAALYAVLGGDAEGLVTAEILCHGVPSVKSFRNYLRDVHGGRRLKSLHFKEKEPYGWIATLRAVFEDGTVYVKTRKEDLYYRIYLSSINKSTACYVCPFNRLPRQADITMADFWGLARHREDWYDTKLGTSLVLTNSDKGAAFLDAVRPEAKLCEAAPLEVAIRGNGVIVKPYGENPVRRFFFKRLDSVPFDRLARASLKRSQALRKGAAKPASPPPAKRSGIPILGRIGTMGRYMAELALRCLRRGRTPLPPAPPREGSDSAATGSAATPKALDILVLGGTKAMGKYMVNKLVDDGHRVTIATRGRRPDQFGDRVSRIVLDRTLPETIAKALRGRRFDVIYDNIVYGSLSVKHLFDSVRCGRYVLISSVAVYVPMKEGLVEEDFDPYTYPFAWCRPMHGVRTGNLSYVEGKRQAESAVYQQYGSIPSVTVRVPYVVGNSVNATRLKYYIERILTGQPLRVDDMRRGMSFVRVDDAGRFLAWLADKDCQGPVNIGSPGMVTVERIIKHIEKTTGVEAVFSDEAPLHPFDDAHLGGNTFSLDTSRADRWGYPTTPHDQWFFGLLDTFIGQFMKSTPADAMKGIHGQPIKPE